MRCRYCGRQLGDMQFQRKSWLLQRSAEIEARLARELHPMTLKELIESRIEPLQPQGYIRDHFTERNGKPFTLRDITKLNEAHPGFDFRLKKNFGMTSIEWGKYSQTGGRDGGSVTIAYSEKNVVADLAYLLEHNARYFSALNARNERRQKILADPELMARFERLVADYLAVKALMTQRREKLDELLEDFDGPFEPDRLSIIDKLLGEGTK